MRNIVGATLHTNNKETFVIREALVAYTQNTIVETEEVELAKALIEELDK